MGERKETENGDRGEGACTEENIIICSIGQQQLSNARCA